MILLSDLLAAGGRLAGVAQAASFADWSYDSRLTLPGSCFVALRTLRADGHDYIPAALAAGATGLLCRWPPADPGGATVILAADPEALLRRWAAARLATVAPTVIGVTGSVGKTTTRRAVAALLGAHQPTFQSRRSFNSLLGLPVALGRLQDDQRYAVLEYGSERPGELAHLTTLFPPQVALVTNVGATHLRGFGRLQAIAKEHAALIAALPPTGSTLLNGDDPLLMALAARSPNVLTYGIGPHCDLRATAVRYASHGTCFDLCWQEQNHHVYVPLLGIPAVYAALAALAVGLVSGLRLADCLAPLATLEPPAGRLNLLPGRDGAQLLDDTFSSTPPSAHAALATLAALPAQRRIAMLGCLSDLPIGSEAPFYQALGHQAAACADMLILKGDWGVVIAHAARTLRPELPISVVDTSEAAVAALPAPLTPNDLILIKGGAEARMERIVARLLADPAPTPLASTGSAPTPLAEPVEAKRRGEYHLKAPPALVRQEPAWRSVRIGQPERPTWLRVDLDVLAGNVHQLCHLAQVPLMAVLKGDGYGHGAVRTARTALSAGAAALAVATLGEGRTLRDHAISAPILLLGYTPPWQAEAVARLGLDATLFDPEAAEALSAAGSNLGQPVRVHIKVDSGMGRLGLLPEQVLPFLRSLQHLRGLEVYGIYTHFASADAPDLGSTEAQLGRFMQLLASLEAAGLRPPIAHAANSAALLRMPATRLDMVRPGIACYGLAPSSSSPLPEGMHPALSFHSEIAQVKQHPAGSPISYGGTFVTSQTSTIATIPVGYADGVRRSPPWRSVIVRGQRVPIVGRICMDYLMADVSAVAHVRRGDAVVLIGSQGQASINADEIATWLDTISYEVLTGIMPRVPREVGEGEG
ncbi:alanine racemase [Candidatus Viridilinea mediisalina]|uniref:Alanine racemase n=1 Tax=Candidatus Viridilinea mediisalina TaxID=2024553 RepID=A0A2A6RI39_9CHLR|nr:alanine racemase [Candidatus Viridilinea mediisalina]PDW02555.1 alanine racemase [Candidatus Viridilinea mediisalina]